MTEILFFGVAAVLLCLLDWRKGVVAALVVGFLADPVRKLLPGQPVALTVAVAVLALVSLAAAIGAQGLRPARQLMLEYRSAARPLQIYLLWVLLAAMMTILNYNSVILAGIGAIAYLAPLPGLLLAYYYGSSRRRIDHFLKLYVVLSCAMTVGIYLSRLGFDWAVFKNIGRPVYISSLGKAYGGFFRTPEVAAWHIGSAICLIVILVVAARRPLPKWLAACLIALLIFAGLLTGRRKMIGQILLFVSFFGLLLAYYRGAAKRLVTLGLVLVVVGGVVAAELVERAQVANEGPAFERYLERGTSVFQDAPDRLQRLGLASAFWAIRRHGWTGRGAGVSSQGSQHFGGGVQLVGGAGEGGLGKIITELGVPGLVISIWLMVAISGTLARTIGSLRRTEPELANLACGLAAFLAAQVPTFIAASQIFGDPFVLIILGSVLGFLLATPGLARVPLHAAYPEAGAVPPMADPELQAS